VCVDDVVGVFEKLAVALFTLFDCFLDPVTLDQSRDFYQQLLVSERQIEVVVGASR
jgi:hypothetical protein